MLTDKKPTENMKQCSTGKGKPRAAVILILLCGLLLLHTQTLFSQTIYYVSINTSDIIGSKGKVVFDFVSNAVYDNYAYIYNFATDSKLGLPETQGGLVTGDLILGLNPAPYTYIQDGSFFNELAVVADSFGDSINFSMELTQFSFSQIPDQFSFFMLDSLGQPMLLTTDPLGADALYSIDITGIAGGALSVFSPMAFTPPDTLRLFVTPCSAIPGDANASGNHTLGDVISMVNYIFNKPGCSPQPLCWLSNLPCRGDWNASNSVTLSDVIQAVNYIFNKPGGPWVPLPIGNCCLPLPGSTELSSLSQSVGDKEVSFRVTGGGTATFGQDLDGNGDIDGSQFGISALLYADGTASGSFNCVMAGRSDYAGLHIMKLTGKFTYGFKRNDGTITLGGIGAVNLGNGDIFTEAPFLVHIQGGGPGIGGLRLSVLGLLDGVPGDQVIGNGNCDFPDEAVSSGHIRIY